MRPFSAASRPLALSVALVAGSLVLLVAAAAVAQDLEPIRDRDYAIDLYQGAVLGSGRIVGMGGAHVALAEGSSGLVANPAAAGVRPATSSGNWDWDWHIDWLNPALGSDFDNNGIETDEALQTFPLVTFGAVLQRKRWAIGLTYNIAQRVVPGPDGSDLQPAFRIGRLVVAHEFRTFTIGFGVRTGELDLDRIEDEGLNKTRLFSITGAGLDGGLVWRPRDRDIRIGAAVSFPVIGSEDLESEDCDAQAPECAGYILPGEIIVPWQVSAGLAWRRADTRWNRNVASRWRDERYLLLSADIVIDGPVDNGHGVEAFFERALQPSGRSTSVSFRTGAEYEWKPGWFRVRGGWYWEPGRFEGVPGRAHFTAGMDVRFWSFCFWEERYRTRFSITGDVADRYANAGVSVGLWH